jgi:hypothetical protein
MRAQHLEVGDARAGDGVPQHDEALVVWGVTVSQNLDSPLLAIRSLM